MPHHTGHDDGNSDMQRMTEMERMFSLAGGGLLALWALRRGGLFASVAAMAGGALIGAAMKRRWPAEFVGEEGGQRANERAIAAERGWNDAAASTRSVTIERRPEEVYRFWRDFSNLGRFMQHVERVEVIDSKRSRWVVAGPTGQSLTWEAVVTEDRPGEKIAWRSEGGDIRNEGWVTFEEEDGGTRVEAFIAYEPPGGQIGRALARIFGEEPSIQSAEDLQKLKQVLEGNGGRNKSRGERSGAGGQTQPN